MLLFLALAGAAILAAHRRGDPGAVRAGRWIMAGLIATAATRLSVPPEAQHVTFGAIWVLAAARQTRPGAGIALAISAACYLVPDLTGAPAAAWSWFYLAANALGLTALAVVAFAGGGDDGGMVGRVDEGRGLDRAADRRGAAGRGAVAMLAAKKEGGP